MGAIWIREFTGGLDTRRLPEATAGGVLIVANDGHISRGGEFEKRAAFVPQYTLPSGTKGLAKGSNSLYVFGSDAAPGGIPAGISYQRLQHPNSVALANVLSVDLYAGKLYVAAEFADGSRHHFYDGARVTDWYDGRARAVLSVVGGHDNTAPSTTTSKLQSILVNGVAIINAPISWAASNENTANLIAAAINSFTSTPDYTAVALGNQVSIVAGTPGAASNGFNVVFTMTDDFAVSPATGLTLANGADTPTGTYQPGTFVKTIGKKMYSVSGSVEHFSGIAAPTKWTTDTTGAGFIDMSAEASDFETLVALARYQDRIAVFAGQGVQLWYTDPDPSLNKQTQVLSNTGTSSPKSVTPFGDNDLFYLDESGIRSLRARDASNAAATTDIGVLIDTIVSAKLSSLNFNERQKIVGCIEPRDGRFWLALKDIIYVFSFFNGAKVSAWSTYTPSTLVEGVKVSFAVDEMVVFGRRVYIRSGDTVYVYAGLGDDKQYDETVAEAWLPYLDADTPTRRKTATGIDAAATGQWSVSLAMNPTNTEVEDQVATISETSFHDATIPAGGESTHFSLRFRSQGGGPAVLSSAVIHYTGGDAEDS